MTDSIESDFRTSNPELRLVVGLGNPGAAYARTRHNLGFRLIDRLERRWGLRPMAGSGEFTLSRTEVEGRRVALARPLTWMNRSGIAVRDLLAREGVEPESMLVCVDDVALDTGRLRVRARGSAGGHNGLRSIEERLETMDYPRLKLGCGPASEELELADFVLGEFASGDEDAVEEMLDRAADAVRFWILEGTEPTMSRFNGPTA